MTCVALQTQISPPDRRAHALLLQLSGIVFIPFWRQNEDGEYDPE